MSVPLAPEDDVLERQLAHLDAMERREVERHTESTEGEPAAVRPLAVQPRWPRAVPPPPPPSGGSLAPYLAWLELACSIVEARVEANSGELERLRSQWVHVVSNLDVLRPEEIDAVAESQARLRETIANYAALHDVLRGEREQLLAWTRALTGPLTDPALIRRLLDEIAVERNLAVRSMTATIVDQITTLLLDLDVTQRRVARDPGAAAGLLQELHERVAGAAARLRDKAQAADPLAFEPGEALQRALQRMTDAHSGKAVVALEWNGDEVSDPDVAVAVASVVAECLGHLARREATSCSVGVDTRDDSTSVRIATPGAQLLPDGDPGWLVRARARTALAGGRLLCGQSGEGSFVEVRF